jgi:hypothetical protein
VADAQGDHAAPPASAGAEASAQGSTNGVATLGEGVATPAPSTSPRAGDEGQVAVSERGGTSVDAAGTSGPAATGAGEARAAAHGKARHMPDKTAKPESGGDAGAKAQPGSSAAPAPDDASAADDFRSVTGDGSDIA